MIIDSALTKDDRTQIDDIYWKHHADTFYIPNLDHTVTHAVVRDNEKVLAFGMVKLYPEAILVMNKDCSLRDRVGAWRMLMNKAIKDTKSAGFPYLHATIHDNAYSSLLSKHYGFKESAGKQVFLEL